MILSSLPLSRDSGGQKKKKGRGEDSGFLNKELCLWCVIEVLEEEKKVKNREMRRELDIWGKGGDGRKELESVNRTSAGDEKP